MFKRHFLVRRHYDTVALASAFALLAALDNAAKFLFALFIFAGIYLVVARHRSIGRVPRAFSLALFGYGAWTIGLSLLRGEPVVGNRQIGYGLIALCFAFFPMGIVLVRRPLRAAVGGARIAVAIAAILSPIEYVVSGESAGLGENVAILAFVLAALGVMTRITVAEPYRYLPNSRLWFYLSLLPVILTQNRAVWVTYVAVFLYDVTVSLWRTRLSRIGKRPFIAALALAAVVALPAVHVVNFGIERGLSDIRSYDGTTVNDTSIGIRISMWTGTVDVMADNLLFGVGAMERVEAVAERMPANADVIRQFTHLHNLVLDEVLSNGLIGLALMFAVFGTFLSLLWRSSFSTDERVSGTLLVFLVFNFGAFHGVMLHETTLMTMYACFSVLLVDRTRRYRQASTAPQASLGLSAASR